MEFEYTTSLFVSESDLDEMCSLCRNTGLDVNTAIYSVSAGWDDCDYYAVGNVIDKIAEEIERRLKEGND